MDLEIDVSQCGEVKLVREAQNFEAAPPAQSSSAYREKFWVSISFSFKKKNQFAKFPRSFFTEETND